MKEKKKVGLYLGVNSVGAAVIQGKKIISLANFELSSLEETQAEALSENIRWEALINKVLRQAGADTDEVYVSLADKDFIFRSLQMPLMKKKEIESSLIYEVEKYVPFKMEELEWDYSYVRFPKERKVNLSFVGIRENNIQRIKDILYRLKINVAAIEPSCLSLLRVVKSSKDLSKFKNFALLDFTGIESYLTFFQNDLPVFNRYITVPKKEEGFDLQEYIEAVNLSFQYFKSEFKTYKLEKIIVAGGEADKDLISSLEEGLQIATTHVLPQDLAKDEKAKVESIKALGVAGREHYPYEFRPVLRRTEEFIEGAAVAAVPPFRLGLLGFLAVAGLAFSFLLSTTKGNEISAAKKQLRNEESLIVVPPEFKDVSQVERKDMVKKRKDKVKALKSVAGSFREFSEFLDILSQQGIILPSGSWLKTLDVVYEKGEYSGKLIGYIFRDDNYKERLAFDELIFNLKNNEIVQSIFSNVEMDYSKKERLKEAELTSFSIKLKGE